MVIHCARLLVVLVFMCASMSGVVQESAAPYQQHGELAATLQDGPLLPAELDPDDDNDGVADIDDSAPNDPTAGQPSVPGTTDSTADNDDDGLPNVMDSDDNHNGQPDANEGIGTQDDVAPEPSNTGTSPTTQPDSSRSPEKSHQDDNQSLIRALPVTGSGAQSSSPPLPAVLIGVVILLATSGFSVRKKRP